MIIKDNILYGVDDNNIEILEIPNGITKIADNAFEKCKSLTNVTFPNTLEEIGNRAFAGCTSIKSLTFPTSLKSIGNNAFKNCFKLLTVKFNEGLETIGNSAFEKCAIEMLRMPSSLNVVGASAFEENTKLKMLRVNENTEIKERCFFNCKALSDINFNADNMKIGNFAFKHCDELDKSLSQRPINLSEGRYCEIYEYAAEFYKANLSGGEEYLKKGRGLTSDTISKFDIGCTTLSTDESTRWVDLQQHLHKKYKVEIEELVAAGLQAQSKTNNRVFDRYRDSIVVPIKDNDGKIKAFIGRKLDKNAEVKYLLPPNTDYFEKSDALFGWSDALKTIKDTKNVYLCEGAFDALALQNIGIKNAVASLGVNLTENQIKFIADNVKKVTLCFDADNAGINGTITALEAFKSYGLDVDIVAFTLDKAKDVDEYIRKYGADKFKTICKYDDTIYYGTYAKEFEKRATSKAFVFGGNAPLSSELGDKVIDNLIDKNISFSAIKKGGVIAIKVRPSHEIILQRYYDKQVALATAKQNNKSIGISASL